MTNTSLDSLPRDFICRACPNGCHLRLFILPENQIDIQGNKCPKGAAYALQRLDKSCGTNPISAVALPPAVRQNGKRPVPHGSACSDEELAEIVRLWGLSLKKTLPHIDIAGSPERSLFRIAFESSGTERFILEQIPPKSYQEKQRIARTLEYLHNKQLTRIQPYLTADKDHRFLLEYKDHFWQIMPFIQGVPLDRTTYIYEKWRGRLLAEFLIELRDKSKDIPAFQKNHSFSMKHYIDRLYKQIKHYHPVIAADIHPVVHFLETGFMTVHDSLPVAFCHGDYHPLNMIWDIQDMKTVIDWEFTGYKPEIYDAANMVGCLGMEHPSSLLSDFVLEFISRLRKARMINEISWRNFPDFMVATRFGWLAEWLKKADTDMIELEIIYMKLLMEERKRWVEAWY